MLSMQSEEVQAKALASSTRRCVDFPDPSSPKTVTLSSGTALPQQFPIFLLRPLSWLYHH
jgi:hypothetical protein